MSTPSPSPSLLSYAAGLESLDPKLHIFDSPDSVLKFWFGPYSIAGDLNSIPYIDSMMGVWFAGKSPQFDQVQRENSDLVKRVAAAGNDVLALGEEWGSPAGYLARVLLLDQFTRCIYRGSPQAFEHDALTARLVTEIVEDKQWFAQEGVYACIQRLFLGVALQHSEELGAQRLGVEMAGRVAGPGDGEELAGWVRALKGYPLEHHDVIARFGRFPGRNTALSRVSSEDEEEWLQSPECPAWAKSQIKKI